MSRTRYQIIYWRDIPVHVRVKDGRKRTTMRLSSRFQETVHRAAFRAKAITGEAYIEEWRPSAWQEYEGDPQTTLETITAGLESSYTEERLDKLARNKGYEAGQT
jgi:hypothetical protein